MRARFVAQMHVETDGGFSVSFPDVAEIATQGETFEEAFANAVEALELVLESRADESEDLPVPRAVNDVVDAIWRAGDHPLVIETEMPGKAVRINISIEERLLSQADRLAEESGQSRSGFIADALRSSLATRRGHGSVMTAGPKAIRGLREAIAHARDANEAKSAD